MRRHSMGRCAMGRCTLRSRVLVIRVERIENHRPGLIGQAIQVGQLPRREQTLVSPGIEHRRDMAVGPGFVGDAVGNVLPLGISPTGGHRHVVRFTPQFQGIEVYLKLIDQHAIALERQLHLIDRLLQNLGELAGFANRFGNGVEDAIACETRF